ncbi:MAG: bifunctional UDP-N-acetylmuramoyl-tripeptide:D-alanyl-D-alanine ligase/alanine racemase [Bacteroidia bacterium]
MSYSISAIAQIVDGNAQLSNPNFQIKYLSIDSRRIVDTSATLFFAISGPRNDGHNHISELINEGIKCFVVNHIPPNISEKEINFIVVEDTVKALQKLCSHHRQTFEYPVIGITGSNGKTIVKEWLYQILNSKLRVVRNPKSYNSQVGVPLSVWQMDDSYDLGIFEAGISQPGEMEILEEILKPTIGIFTNLGDAHSENFENSVQKVFQKFDLFTNCNVLIAKKGNYEVDEFLRNWKESKPERKLLTWSDTRTTADLFITPLPDKKVRAKYKGITYIYSLPFDDLASVENSATCLLTALHLGFEINFILKKLTELQPVEMRLQKIEGINNTILINDTYNSDINSFEISVDFITRQDNSRSRTVILSDILQTEKSSAELYSTVNSILKAKDIDRFIGIGPELEANSVFITIPNKTFYHSTKNFLSKFDLKSFKNENILLKGARNFGLEQVVKLLEKQTHQTVFEINLSAIEVNFRYFKSLVPKQTKTMGMVKAYSYGSGSFEVAKLLQDAGVDYLAVAYTDEGVALRQKGITKPIMVMNPDERAFDTMLEYNLEPEIYSFGLLHSFIKVCENSGKSGHGIHIEFDTGMHRLGFSLDNVEQLIAELLINPKIEVKSIFSHLAGSDEKRLSEFTKNQISLFKNTADHLAQSLPNKPLLHILNSAGVLHYPEGIFDMIRLGIGLHGIDPSDFNKTQLTEAGSLKSYISQIKKIKAGDGISYGLNSVSDKDRTIAIVAIGYADGLNRKLSNGNWQVLINDKKAPTVGKICMDMFMADVSNIKCKEGDEVLLFGKGLSIENMAAKVGTIAYEILTSISPRVKRVYWYE